MLKTFRTGKDNQYGFKRRLIIACGNYIARKPVELSTEQLAYEITIAFYYDKETYIKLDYIDLCIIIRTLVILKITPREKIEIFKLWQNIAINQIDMFDSQAIANTFTAITKLKVNEKIELPHRETKEILKALIQEVKKKIEKFNSQDIANTFWALAKLECKQEEIDRLLPELLEAARKNIEKFNSQDITNTLWALAKLKVKSEEIKDLLPLLINVALNNIKHFNSQDIANTLWALAKLEVKREEIAKLLPELIEAALENIKGFNSQGIANILWALAILEQDLNDFSALKANIIKRLKALKLEDFTIENKRQLFQALAYYNLFLLLSNLGINTELIKKELASPLSSQLHKDVENNLQLLIKASLNDNEVISEFFLPEIASYVDIKLQYKGKTYYIEIDGPTHFNEEGNYTAIDKFHNRLFAKECPGEIMLRLPYFFLQGKAPQGLPTGSKPDLNILLQNLNILLQKILEDIEKLEKPGVYVTTPGGLKKSEETLLPKMKNPTSITCGNKKEEVAPVLLKGEVTEESNSNSEGEWRAVSKKTRSKKQGAAPATSITCARVGNSCKQLLTRSK